MNDYRFGLDSPSRGEFSVGAGRATRPCPPPAGRVGFSAFGLSPGAKLSGGSYTLRISQGGNLVEAKPEQRMVSLQKPIGGPRGQVQTFSPQSRRRLRLLFDRLGRDAVSGALFVTLTYHAQMRDAGRAKRHLQSFSKRLDREYEGIALIWRMEVQKRGSIHFHLLIFGVGFIPWQWVADNWTAIVAPGDPEQLAAGTQVQKVRSYAEARHYLEKYLSKVDQTDDDDENGPGHLENPGRWWGVRGSLDRFQAPVHEVRMDAWAMSRLARTLDKLHKARVGRVVAAKQAKDRAPGWMYRWARRRKKRVLFQTSRWSLDGSCLVSRLGELMGISDA